MKANPTLMNRIASNALLPAALFLALQGASLAQSSWTGTSNTTWSGAGNWSPSGAPASGASVVVDRNSVTPYTISLDASPTLTNWNSNVTGNSTTVLASGGNQTLNITGALTKTGDKALQFRSNGANKLAMTVETIDHTGANGTGNNLTFGLVTNELAGLNIATATVSSSNGTNTLAFIGANNTANYTIGTMNLGTNGVVLVANGIVSGDQRALNIGSLNGTGGTIRGANGAVTTGIATLNLTGTSDGSYSGAIIDGAAVVRVVKSGSATQTLGGSYIYTGGTLITGGTLLTTKAAALSSYNGTGKVEVNGGTIGVQVGGSGWTTGQIDALLGNATKTSGALGIDTTNGSLNQWTAFTASNLGSLGLTKLGANTLTLNGTNTYTGATTVTAGTLVVSGGGSIGNGAIVVKGGILNVNGSVGNGGVTVDNGATLSGNGTIGGITVVNGNLNPGNSPGTLNFTAALTLNGTVTMEITGITAGAYDILKGNGSNTLTLGGTLALNDTGYTAALHDSIQIFQNWLSISGSFSSITGTDLGGGLSWDTSAIGSTGYITVVPEPSPWLLFAGGLTFVIVMRRRRA